MATAKPMLGDVELQLVQKIDAEEDEVLAQHAVPALEGDFLQDLGRRAERVELTGVITGQEAGDGLKALREKFRTAEAISFVADIATATKVDKVLIEEMSVRELAGKPERFEYAFGLREFLPPPKTQQEKPPSPPPPPPPPPPLPSVETGTLVIEVIVEGQPEFDFGTVTVTLVGTRDDGTAESRTLTNRADGVWTEENMAPGRFTARAVVTDPQPMSGETAAAVRGGQTTQVQITLHRGAAVAKAFIIHFRFDSAFVEPCMGKVFERVFEFAQSNPSEKILIVGHTDLAGSDEYNQSLSERRARSVFAFMTFGTSAALRTSAIDDLNNLRRRPLGGLPSINDNWGTREYQFMLEDLEFYSGNIDEVHGPKTDAAIRTFQQENGLPITGLLDDATWPVLIEAYLEADGLAIPESRFFANAKDGCDGGILKWLGCGEQDPVKNTQDAWRPNRRVEILFIRDTKLPCEVPQPVTFDLPTAGAVSPTWCLGPGDPDQRGCFATRTAAQNGKFLIHPAEPNKVTVSGTITFDDGTPVANAKYALIAPDGEFLHVDAQGKADLGERPQGPERGRPIRNRADEAGRFAYPKQTPVGVYIMEVFDLHDPQVARERSEPSHAARGNVVCVSLDRGAPAPANRLALVSAPDGTSSGLATLDTRVQSGPVPPPPVDPILTPDSTVIMVKKTYTNPPRVGILLGVKAPFRRTGILTRSGNTGVIKLFNALTGREISFIGGDNEFTGAALHAGVQLFAEGVNASGNLNDYTLTLDLAPGTGTPSGSPIAISLTAVSLQLDICVVRTVANVDPAALPQPPPVQPPAGTATDKWFGGRLLNVQDPSLSQERAMLIVRRPEPAAFSEKLVLLQVQVTGTNVGNLDGKARLFDFERPNLVQPGNTPHNNRHSFDFPLPPTALLKFFVEGTLASSTLRDTGFQLGLANGESDGDRIALTIAPGPAIVAPSKAVVVKKPHTNPARQLVKLLASNGFAGSGKLDRSGNTSAIKLFNAKVGGAEISFNNTDNVFTGAQLVAGVDLFAEGITVSGAVDDYQLTLTLTRTGSSVVGNPFQVRMTAVEVTLDVALSRPTPSAPPPVLSAADKVNIGRFLIVQDAAFTHERALLIVRPVQPAGFQGTLEVTSGGGHVQLFEKEIASGGQVPLGAGHPVPPTGAQLFLQGFSPSGALRDTEFRLGIKGLEPIADLVKITVFPDPSLPGPFAVGEHEYALPAFTVPATTESLSEEAQLEIGAPSRSVPSGAFPVALKALVRYPAQVAGVDKPVAADPAKFPLVIIAHGNHRIASPGGPVESFRGLEYLARHLASYGYIAASIDLNDMNVPVSRTPAIVQRGLTILEHLNRWATFHTGDPIFTGKVDLDQIALLGHSRGAEAVVSAQRTNVDAARGHKIKSVISIAPTDFLGIALPSAPYFVLYGSEDGDVSIGWPFRLYDRAAAFKAMVFVYGAIHNRFSTDPDWLSQIDSNDPRRLSEADHLNLARGYCVAFLDLNIRNVGDHLQLFKKNGRPSTISSAVELHHQVQDPVRLIVDDFEQGVLNRAAPLPPQLAARAGANTLGAPVTVAGLAVPTGLAAALTESSLQHRDTASFWHDTVAAMVAWDAAGGQYTTTVGDRNVAAFAVLSFRVTQRFGSVRNPDPPGAVQDCTVTLTDSAGQFAAVRVGTVALIPFPYKRTDATLTKSALKTIRIPLPAFKQANASLNLNSIRTVTFVFNVTGRGELAIDDIEFSN